MRRVDLYIKGFSQKAARLLSDSRKSCQCILCIRWKFVWWFGYNRKNNVKFFLLSYSSIFCLVFDFLDIVFNFTWFERYQQESVCDKCPVVICADASMSGRTNLPFHQLAVVSHYYDAPLSLLRHIHMRLGQHSISRLTVLWKVMSDRPKAKMFACGEHVWSDPIKCTTMNRFDVNLVGIGLLALFF